MNIDEFSKQFDVRLNSQAQQMGIGQYSNLQLDEYEKSVFLTQAQDEFVLGAYTGKNNNNNLFEYTEEDRRFLSRLVKTVPMQEVTNIQANQHSVDGSRFFRIQGKEELMYIIFERCTLSSSDPCINGKVVEVVPVTHDELHNLLENPFRGANKRRVLRLDVQDDMVELISEYDFTDYRIRFLQRPYPIILIDLYSSGLSINGYSSIRNCQLNPATHEIILNRAVQLALMSKSLNQKVNNQTT